MRDYLTVSDLTTEQMTALKQAYLCQHYDECEDNAPSYAELADANSIVDDSIIFDAYADMLFSPDDFFV